MAEAKERQKNGGWAVGYIDRERKENLVPPMLEERDFLNETNPNQKTKENLVVQKSAQRDFFNVRTVEESRDLILSQKGEAPDTQNGAKQPRKAANIANLS